ncbi:Eco57I restriction-modification methylase domain-containing protein [Patescibacteria group bacterium]|nr:Eco57I restriction-modification methylase domain-containing protein [Patescibacteria group bacterium]
MQNNYNPDVLSCLANLSSDEVFTPPKLANEILDLLPKEIWKDKNATFLDPVCKTGVFLREIVKRLLEGLKDEIPDDDKRREHIYKNQIFGIGITELTSLLSRRSLYCSKLANGKYSVVNFGDEKGNIFFDKTNHNWKNGQCSYCGASQSEYEREEGLESHAYQFIHNNLPDKIKNMKFDVIIGNPPYQMSDGGGTGSSAIPLYHKFVEQAKKLSPRYLTMIIPSRWFTGGKGLDNFRDTMLNDNSLREIHDFLDASECFSGVSIEGGVCYFLWKRDDKGLCKVLTHSSNGILSSTERPLLEEGADVFIRYNEVISIIRKVISKSESNFSVLVSPRNPYGIGNDVLDGTFSDRAKKINVLGILKSERVIKKIPAAQLGRNIDELNSYRLFISKADGAAGQIGNPIPARIIGKIVVAEPNMACTETFLRIGLFKNEKEVLHVKRYMETKFFRVLVGARKNKNMTRDTYSFVPMQDFSESWTDEKLYKKYGLTKEEIDFIESMIRPMN